MAGRPKITKSESKKTTSYKDSTQIYDGNAIMREKDEQFYRKIYEESRYKRSSRKLGNNSPLIRQMKNLLIKSKGRK